jgi:predicted Zn-dependent protease
MLLQTLEIVDFQKMLFEEDSMPAESATQPAGTDAPGAQGAAAAGAAETTSQTTAGAGAEAGEPAASEPSPEQRAEASRLIDEARADIEANHLQSAVKKLETAKMLVPRRFEVYDMLADAHKRLGQEDKAREARRTVQKLRAGQAIEAGGEDTDATAPK